MKRQLISKPLYPNAGIKSWYVKKLQALVKEMYKECNSRLGNIYKDLHFQITLDESISSQARIALNELSKKYYDKFSKESKKIVSGLLKKTNSFATRQFLSAIKAMLGDGADGFTLSGSIISPEKEEVIKALLFENVSLIKSIPEEYFKQITGAVARSIENGEGIKYLVSTLKTYGVKTLRRAQLIAQDQTRKAHNTINLRNFQENGARKFKWLHSGGSRDPRKYHKYILNGQIFDIDKGAPSEKNKNVYIFPGQEPYCHCIMQIVLDKGQQYNWFDSTWICWLSGFSLVVLSFLIVWEIENKNSFMKIRLFKDRNFLVGTIIITVVSMVVFTTMYLVPQFLQNVIGYTALLSGYTLAPRVVSCVLMLFAIPHLMKVYDSRLLISIGFLFLGFSTFMYTNVNLSVPFIYVTIPNILLGIGVILTFIPISALALGTLPKEYLADGASLHNFCKTVGVAIVVSMSSTIVARHSQMHQNYLVDNLSNYSLVYQNKMASLIHTFSVGASGTFAQNKANAYVYKQMVAQSTLMAYVDAFAIVALMAFILTPLPFLMKNNIDEK